MSGGLLTVSKTAEFLAISRSKVYDLIYRGVLRSLLIGRARRVDREDLEAFIERQKKGGSHGKGTAKGNFQERGRAEFVDQLRREAGVGGEPAA